MAALPPYTLGDAITAVAPARPYRRQPADPVHRPLRIYTQDPDVSMHDAPLTIAKVSYEPVEPGPVGALFRVHDENETRREVYAPVDLDSPDVLRQQGLPASTADPRFAQQMTYAVAMTVFESFALALGRTPEFAAGAQGRLTIRPHFREEDNAYYDDEAARLDFGYVFATSDAGGRLQKGAVVFTALSHDIIAHETTHALLDGMRPLFLMPTNPDVAAFHEAFADLVALLLRFRYRELVERALSDATLDLSSTLLTQVARQWGRSAGSGGAALRRVTLEAGAPDAPVDRAHQYDAGKEEHDLGAVLVAAVFDAMNRVFVRKTKHVRQLAATPHAPQASVTALLAAEAQKLAAEFLNILVRAIDYCPPVDVTFGEYLRALVTADAVTVPDDPCGYREALVYAFRRYGIRVDGVADLSEESLLWCPPERPLPPVDGLAFGQMSHVIEPGWPVDTAERRRRADALGAFVTRDDYREYFGLATPSRRDGIEPPVIQSVRTLRRLTPDRELDFHVVAEITQRRTTGRRPFHGGATVVLDETGTVRYVVGKGVMSRHRQERTSRFLRTASPVSRRAASGEAAGRRDLLREWHRKR